MGLKSTRWPLSKENNFCISEFWLHFMKCFFGDFSMFDYSEGLNQRKVILNVSTLYWSIRQAGYCRNVRKNEMISIELVKQSRIQQCSDNTTATNNINYVALDYVKLKEEFMNHALQCQQWNFQLCLDYKFMDLSLKIAPLVLKISAANFLFHLSKRFVCVPLNPVKSSSIINIVRQRKNSSGLSQEV